jgi:hypothetical protein
MITIVISTRYNNMQQPYNILPTRTSDRIAKTFYYNKKGEVRWWDGKQLKNKEKIKEYRAVNKEKIKKKIKKYRAVNKEKIKKKEKEYRAVNKEKIKERKKEYYAANKERKKEYYAANKEKVKKYKKEYNAAHKERINTRYRWRYKNDENFRLRDLLRSRFRKALKSKNIKKNSHVLELTSCSMDFLKNYLSKKFKKGMTWGNQGQWHIDHRKPCASFDFSDKEEQRKCFHYTNLQPLWGKENKEKSATFDEATFEYKWTEEQGWVLR